MFNHPTSRPHASPFVANDSYAFSQPWARFDLGQPASLDPSGSHHGALDGFASSPMDWTPASTDESETYQPTDAQLASLSSEHNGGGVGRLVAHFENKFFVPLENKPYAPPLPPRPAQGQPSAPRAHLDSLEYFGNGLASSFNPPPRSQSPAEAQWGGGFGLQLRALGRPAHAPRAPAPAAAGQFGVLEDFMSPTRLQSPAGPALSLSQAAPSPMISPPPLVSPAEQPPPTSGTSSFEIWRPPVCEGVKPEPLVPPALPAPGYAKPPVPNTPKPTLNSSANQFILEFSPGTKAKGKAPAKPPRLRAPPPSAAPPFSPEIKQEPVTPQTSQLPPSMAALPVSNAPGLVSRAPSHPQEQAQRQTSGPLRTHAAGTRPSREQVPAEAWEQFKSTIRTLYLDERRPLKEVMNVMVEKYNFQAT